MGRRAQSRAGWTRWARAGYRRRRPAAAAAAIAKGRFGAGIRIDGRCTGWGPSPCWRGWRLFSAACGGAGIRAGRDAVRHPASGRATQAEVDRLLRPAGRGPGRSGGRLHPLRGSGRRRGRFTGNSSASIPATPSRTSTSLSTAPSAAIASGCTCMWRRRASSSRGAPASLNLAQLRDACRSPSGSIPPSSTGWRPPPTRPPARGPRSSITSTRSGNGARAGRS